MAAAIVRSISRVRLTCAAASRRLFTSTISSPPPLPGLARSHISILTSAAPAICHSLCLISPCSVRFNSVRCWINTPGPPYSPRNSGSNLGEFQPELAPLFPGCDYEHWLIAMEKPGGEGATKQQMIDCYIQTLAKVLGSEEEAKKKIYNVSCERYYGFGCEIDEETSKKLHGLPGVFFVIPDTYVDAENKDYGGELFVNGEIVQRSPERQKRVEAVSHRSSRQTK